MRASHAHIGVAQTVVVSGFNGNHRGLNGPYDVDLTLPDALIYRRRSFNALLPVKHVPFWAQLKSWATLGSYVKSKMARLAFDSHVKGGGRWTLRDEDGGTVVGHVQPGEWPTPEGEYCDAATGRTRVNVTPERATPSLWAAHVFPAPSLSRDDYAISTRHAPLPLLEHPGLAMLSTCQASWRNSSSGSSSNDSDRRSSSSSNSSSEPLLSSYEIGLTQNSTTKTDPRSYGHANSTGYPSHGNDGSRIASVFTRCSHRDARCTLLYSHSAEDDLGVSCRHGSI